MSNTTYVQNNPDLIAHYNANVKGSGKSMDEWGAEHWEAYGKNEGRENTPTHVETAKPVSPASYRPDVAIASTDTKVFDGTNIPTAGYSQEQITHYNARLNEAIGEGDTRNANDVLFDIAYAKKGVGVAQGRSEGFGQGNENVGAVQSGMYKLDSGPLWAEQRINSTNDRYVLRDEQGAPTGERIRYDDAAGVVKGTPGNWTSVGSWGGSEKAGILKGQPTTTPPPSGILSTGITDLDENQIFATGTTGTTGITGITGTTGTTGTTRVGGGLLGNMYEAAYEPRGLLDWGQYQTDPNFVLQQNNLANYQTWAKGIGDRGALPVYGAGTGTSNYVNNTGSNSAYNSVMDATNTNTNTNTSNIVKDASGKSWIMTSDGQWIPSDSTYGSILASGDPSKYPAGHYDSNGMWVGAEGFDPIFDSSLPGMGYKHGLDPNNPNATVTSAYGISPAGTVGWGPSSTLGGIFGTGTGDPNDPGIGQIDW